MRIAKRHLKKQSQFGKWPDGRKRIIRKGLCEETPISGAEKQRQTNPIITDILATEGTEDIEKNDHV